MSDSPMTFCISTSIGEKKWMRNCPKCNKKVFYKKQNSFIRAKNKNTHCRSCLLSGENNPFYGKKHKKSLKEKFSEERKNWYYGSNNPMYGKSTYDIWAKKYGPEIANQKQLQSNEKNKISNTGSKNSFYGKSHTKKLKNTFSIKRRGENNPNFNIKHTEEWKQKARERTLERIKTLTNGKIGYNPNACKYFDKLNTETGWCLQHAENGGEIDVIGYSLDAYDNKRNIVVEYDEPLHNKPYRNNEDIKRMNKIKKHLQCKFYRFDEKTNTLKLYE